MNEVELAAGNNFMQSNETYFQNAEIRLLLSVNVHFCFKFLVESYFVSVLVDKDNSPEWNPSTLEAVSKEKVDSYFATLGDREMVL